MSVLDGIDLCAFPSAVAPDGVSYNFVDPPTYAPAMIAVSILMMTLATLFTIGRVFANRSQLMWSDCRSESQRFRDTIDGRMDQK